MRKRRTLKALMMRDPFSTLMKLSSAKTCGGKTRRRKETKGKKTPHSVISNNQTKGNVKTRDAAPACPVAGVPSGCYLEVKHAEGDAREEV